MPTTTVVQSHIAFKVKGKVKKLVYNGAMSLALDVVRQLYPYHCCKQGHTIIIKFEVSGTYIITDVLSGKIEHSVIPDIPNTDPQT